MSRLFHSNLLLRRVCALEILLCCLIQTQANLSLRTSWKQLHSPGKGLAICHHQSKLEENLPTSDKSFTKSDRQMEENELTVPRTSANIVQSHVETSQLAVTAGVKACSVM